VVGWALRGNIDSTIPCHRVVKKGGVLAGGFSLGNWPEQRRRLTAEGIIFAGCQIQNFDQSYIDLNHSNTSN
jgi:alkylated DNA nucleotide flippase Atl1